MRGRLICEKTTCIAAWARFWGISPRTAGKIRKTGYSFEAQELLAAQAKRAKRVKA